MRLAALTAGLGGALAAALHASPAAAQDVAADESSVEQLRDLSIEDLANLPVTTVSRREEALARTPAAAYVITREAILRSGAQTLPEILRLAPNLFVAQTGASTWTITARGLSGSPAAQAFSNKLLVLIDGRSVYTPLYSGVYWDLQDVPPEDIDHIEVISGPGATLWGANAVNGVINIITRSADETQGGLVSGAGGDRQQAAFVRYGARLGELASWRAYLRGYRAENLLTSAGDEAQDRWSRLQGGFRLDWTPTERDAVSLHGDAFKGWGPLIGGIGGGNLTGRWTHFSDSGGSLQVQTYFNREERGRDLAGGLPLWINTFDLDVQNQRAFGPHDVVMGMDLRTTRYSLNNTPTLQFAPAKGTLNLASVFAQDTVSLTPTLRLTLALKYEDDPYSAGAVLPQARLAWTPDDRTMFWGAVSRAIRSPTPFDRDVREIVTGVLLLAGGADFRPETLTAFELGARLRPADRLSLSASAYYNLYDDLRSIELTAGGPPLVWGNEIKGETHGVELWGDYQAAPWWRLSASLNLLNSGFEFKPGGSGLLGLSQVGDDPRRQAKLKSFMTLPHGVSWDAELRYQSELPASRTPAYTELNTRIAWAINERLELSVSGFNLLHSSHQEFAAPLAEAVPRSVLAGLRWAF